ncbi:MAG: RDD family protein, partial [Halobacteriota archaeon]
MATDSPGYLGTEQDVIMARVGAFIVDHVLSFIAALILGYVVGVSTRSIGMIYLGVFAGLIGYFIVLEAWSGQTIGKWLFGVVVVAEDGSPISPGQSVVRNLLRL